MIISTSEEMNPSRRSTMEDVFVVEPFPHNPSLHYMAIYDGHGGRATVDFLKQALFPNIQYEWEYGTKLDNDNTSNDANVSFETRLERAMLVTDIQAHQYGITTSGATVALCVVDASTSNNNNDDDEPTMIYTANVGDARIVAGCQSTSSAAAVAALRLTHDHSAHDDAEIKRIEREAGGFCLKGRVVGILAVSRSLGDFGLKQFVTARPHTSATRTKSISFLILACDGLWDVLTDDEAVTIVHKYSDKKEDEKKTVASELTRIALDRGTTDNVTVIVCWL